MLELTLISCGYFRESKYNVFVRFIDLKIRKNKVKIRQ